MLECDEWKSCKISEMGVQVSGRNNIPCNRPCDQLSKL